MIANEEYSLKFSLLDVYRREARLLITAADTSKPFSFQVKITLDDGIESYDNTELITMASGLSVGIVLTSMALVLTILHYKGKLKKC